MQRSEELTEKASGARRMEEPGQAEQRRPGEKTDSMAQDVTRMERGIEYRRKRSNLPGKGPSGEIAYPYRKWTHMGEERILR